MSVKQQKRRGAIDMNEENNELMPKFDPKTGERLVKESEDMSPKFDPKTGERLVKENDNMPLKFDPKTGEPISNKEVAGKRLIDFTKWGDRIKRHKIITGVVVIVGIGAISAGAILNTPKVKVTRAVLKTFKSISSYETALDAKLGKQELLNTIFTGKSQQELKLNISKAEVGGYANPFAKNMGINIKFASDIKANKLMANIAALYKDDILFNTSIYNDKEQVMFYIPELYDEYFYLNKNNLKSKFKESDLNEYLLHYMGYETESDLEDLDPNVLTDFFGAYINDNKALLKDAYSQMSVEKTNERNFKINGKNKAYKGYTITISEKIIKQLLSSLNKSIQNDNQLENIFLSMGMSEWAYENALENIDELVEVIKDGIQNEVVYEIYMNHKGEIIYFESESELDIEDNSITASVEVDFSGGKNIYDNIMLECALEQDRERIGFSFERESGLSNNQYEASNELIITDGYDEITLNSEASFNQKTGDFDVVWEFKDDYDDVTSLEVEGKLENIKKAKGFDATFDSIKLTNQWDEQVVLEGAYSVGELKEPIAKLSNKGEDLLDSSYEDIREIFEKMGEGLESIGEEIYYN